MVILIGGLLGLSGLLPVVAGVVSVGGFVVCAGKFGVVGVVVGILVAGVLFVLNMPPVPPPPNTPPVVDGVLAGGFVVVLAVGLPPNKLLPFACSVGFPC